MLTKAHQTRRIQRQRRTTIPAKPLRLRDLIAAIITLALAVATITTAMAAITAAIYAAFPQ